MSFSGREGLRSWNWPAVGIIGRIFQREVAADVKQVVAEALAT
jgi:hypothetical protein